MDVKFITTTSTKLNTIPIVDGQVITTSDRNNFYYDMSSKRNKVGGIVFMQTISGTGEEGILYVISNPIGLYLWEDNQFKPLLPETGIADAPNDGKLYGRKNKTWEEVPECTGINDAPSDDKIYGRKNETWIEISSSTSGIEDAPKDGFSYVRKDNTWNKQEFDVYLSGLWINDYIKFFSLIPKIISDRTGKASIKINLIGKLEIMYRDTNNTTYNPLYTINLGDGVSPIDCTKIEFDFSKCEFVCQENMGTTGVTVFGVTANNENSNLTFSNLFLSSMAVPTYHFRLINSDNPFIFCLKDSYIVFADKMELINLGTKANIKIFNSTFKSNGSSGSTTYLINMDKNPYITLMGNTFHDLAYRIETVINNNDSFTSGNIVDSNIMDDMPGLFPENLNLKYQI